MKLNGRTLKNDNIEIVVIPRDDGNLVFRFKPVLDEEAFNAVCPEPKAPLITDKDGRRHDTNDKDYRESIIQWATKKTHWMFLESISATEDLQWDTVDIANPATYQNYDKELEAAGFTMIERIYLQQAFNKVNSLNTEHLEAARRDFLATTRETGNQ